MVGSCMSRNGPRPTNQINPAAMAAICDVGRHDDKPGPPAAAEQPNRQPVLQEKQIGGTDAEHDERVSVRAIAKSAPEGERLIFLHREGIDVSDSAPFEMSGGGMMDGVSVAPEIIRRQRQHADHSSHPVICRTLAKK